MDRKRITRLVTGLLFLGMIFFVGRTCQAENADIKLVFINASDGAIAKLSATVLRETEVVATIERTMIARGDERAATLELDPGSYTLEIEILVNGELHRSQRRLEAVPRATVRIQLRAIAAPAEAPASADEG